VVGLKASIERRKTIDFHAHASLHATLHRAKIPPIEDFLQEKSGEKNFTPDLDRKFSDHAEKLLKEKRAEYFRNGRRSKN